MNTNTYYNISKSTFYVMILSSLFDILSHNTLLYGSLDNISYISTFLFCFLTFSRCSSKTKDLKEINELYNEFLNNYKILNETFNLNEPLSIYKMYVNLLYNGYLSKDKTFEFNNQNSKEFNNLFGINIFNGYGVCRHISPMLSDILNKSNITSYNISTYVEEEKDKYLSKLLGNHLITFATLNNYDYFLDPTRNKIYRRDDNILYGKDNIKITSKIIDIDNFYSKYSNSDKINKTELFKFNKNIEENIEYEIFNYIDKLFNDNKDIIEKFYNDNKEIYETVSNKTLKIKKTLLNLM